MRVTASTRDPRLQPLARLASTFLTIASQNLTRVQPRHIPGKVNIEADYLSRSQNGAFVQMTLMGAYHTSL